MGADIHLYIETRLSPNDEWSTDNFHSLESSTEEDDEGEEYQDTYLIPKHSKYHYSYGGRNYEMFGILADVRGKGCLYQPRGIPKDVAKSTKKEIDRMDSDGHSHSYLSLKEFKECLNVYTKATDYRDTEYEAIYDIALEWLNMEQAEAKILETGFEPEIRFVFFFDN